MKHINRDAHPTIEYRIKPLVVIAVICFFIVFLTGCGFSGYDKYDGIDRVASSQRPPAEKLIWSRTDPNEFLIDASEVGFGLTLNDAMVYTLDISTGQIIEVIAETDRGTFGLETWSPDQQKVVLYVPSSTKGYENYKGLWIWDSQTKEMEFLWETGHVRWSPSDDIVAIIDNSISGDAIELHLVDLNTDQEKVIIIGKIDEIGYLWDVDWSPDGKRLVLSLGNPKTSIPISLFIFDIQDQRLTLLADGGNYFSPAWSPQGGKIAYVKHVEGSSIDSLHLINTDGSCDIPFPYLDHIQSLSWSPDGKKLAFIGPDGIYTLDVESFLEKYVGSNLCP